VVRLSGQHGIGVDDLLDAILTGLPPAEEIEAGEEAGPRHFRNAAGAFGLGASFATTLSAFGEIGKAAARTWRRSPPSSGTVMTSPRVVRSVKRKAQDSSGSARRRWRCAALQSGAFANLIEPHCRSARLINCQRRGRICTDN